MRAHQIWTATCETCDPWVRVVANPSTNQPVVQELHEPACLTWPKLTRPNREVW